MALLNVKPVQHLECCFLNRTDLELFKANSLPMQSRGLAWKPLIIEAKFRKRANSRTESAKNRNRRLQQKYNGTPTKPRLSVFCSDKQLYAMLVDDLNKKCLYYGSTLQKSLRSDPDIGTAEAAKVVGEELVKAAMNLSIDEITSYDRNGCVRGERVKAFEIAISQHGFLPR
ncbi:50S ribosomal protein L18 [Bienertia sinuspersici]